MQANVLFGRDTGDRSSLKPQQPVDYRNGHGPPGYMVSAEVSDCFTPKDWVSQGYERPPLYFSLTSPSPSSSIRLDPSYLAFGRTEHDHRTPLISPYFNPRATLSDASLRESSENSKMRYYHASIPEPKYWGSVLASTTPLVHASGKLKDEFSLESALTPSSSLPTMSPHPRLPGEIWCKISSIFEEAKH